MGELKQTDECLGVAIARLYTLLRERFLVQGLHRIRNLKEDSRDIN